MTRLNKVVGVIAGAAVLVGGANLAAYAGKGRPLLLGHDNAGPATTKITKTVNGPALRLRTRPTQPPLAVTSATKVRRLNADLLDGRDSTALQTRAIRFGLPELVEEADFSVELNGIPNGVYAVDFWVLAAMDTAAATLSCYIEMDDGSYALLAYGVDNSLYSSSTGSGTLDLRHSSDVVFRCFTSAGKATVDFDSKVQAQRSQVTFTRVDTLIGSQGQRRPDTKSLAPATGGSR